MRPCCPSNRASASSAAGLGHEAGQYRYVFSNIHGWIYDPRRDQKRDLLIAHHSRLCTRTQYTEQVKLLARCILNSFGDDLLEWCVGKTSSNAGSSLWVGMQHRFVKYGPKRFRHMWCLAIFNGDGKCDNAQRCALALESAVAESLRHFKPKSEMEGASGHSGQCANDPNNENLYFVYLALRLGGKWYIE